MLSGVFNLNLYKDETKRIWRIVISSILISHNLISFPGFLLTTKTLDLPNIFYFATSFSLSFYTFCFIPLLVKYFENELKTILQLIENPFTIHESRLQSIDFKFDKYDTLSIGLRLMIYPTGFFGIPFTFLNLFYAILLCEKANLNKQELFLLATPYYDYVNSYSVYIIINIFHMYCVWITGVIMVMIGSFYVMLSCELYNVYVDLCSRLYHRMNYIILELAADDCCIATNKSDLFHEFRNEFAIIVERQQLLKR